MDIKRDVTLEMAIAGLLIAAGENKEQLIQRANAAILGTGTDEFGGGANYKSAACGEIEKIAARV